MSGAIPPILEAACQLAGQGIAAHWLRPRSKAPLADQWSSAPIATPNELRSSYREGLNLGIRLGEFSKVGDGFLQAIDLDIRDPSKRDEAWAHLRKMAPGVDLWPFVISGSGGESRHFYVYTDRPFPSRKLAHSSTKFEGKDGKQHWSWEIELFGTGKQVAAPPSIHPDTGKEYVWGRRIPFDEIDMGLGPFVSAEVVQGWGVNPDNGQVDDDDDGLTAEAHRRPLGLADAEIQETLDDLDHDQYCEDREGWLIVGMALNHETEGSERGLEIWQAFSAKSKKYDPKDIRRVWDSFRGRLVPVRFPTLIKAAGIARLERDHEQADDAFDDLAEKPAVNDPEIDDLLGAPSPKPESTDDIDNIGTSGPDPHKDWIRRLDFNEEGVLKPTLHNVEMIIRHDPRLRGLPQLNEFTWDIVQRRVPGKMRRKREGANGTRQLEGPVWLVNDPVSGDEWTDAKDGAVRSIIEAPKTQGGYGIKVTDRDLSAAIHMVAMESKFHPIREYLSKLKWDGKPRADGLFIDYLGSPDNPYNRDIARLFLLGAVVRAFEPGHKFDFVPILEGIQGKRKSSFIEILAKHWFTELQGDFADRKRMVEKMLGAWILELPELTGFTKSEVEEIKAFISAKHDKDRLAYERRAKRFLRQCVFIGSTNGEDYLRDPTGARRFWPVPCFVEEIDTERFTGEVDQFWAEAVAIYRDMRAKQPHGTLPLFLRDAAKLEAQRLQESRRAETAEEILGGRIGAWLEQPKRDSSGFDDEDALGRPVIRDQVCLAEIWTDCLGRDFAHLDNRQSAMLGRAMKYVDGWLYVNRERTPEFGRQRVYRRKETELDSDLI
jgi:predicted P-loop ATPase